MELVSPFWELFSGKEETGAFWAGTGVLEEEAKFRGRLGTETVVFVYMKYRPRACLSGGLQQRGKCAYFIEDFFSLRRDWPRSDSGFLLSLLRGASRKEGRLNRGRLQPNPTSETLFINIVLKVQRLPNMSKKEKEEAF
jgi:hypothetical protein